MAIMLFALGLQAWLEEAPKPATFTSMQAEHKFTDEEILKSIEKSDYFEGHKVEFLKASRELIEKHICDPDDFVKFGGWVQSTRDPSMMSYFTYCGGMQFGNKWYITLPSPQPYHANS